jgi:uncharacterized protein (TIGR00251 family)
LIAAPVFMSNAPVDPSKTPAFLQAEPDGIVVSIKLQPRASANEICQPLGHELKIKVCAPPVDSAANEALIRLLSEELDCPRNRLELIRGHSSRHKTVKIYGASLEHVIRKLTSSKGKK